MMVMTLFKHTDVVSAEDFALVQLMEAFETSHKRHLVDGDDEELILSSDGANTAKMAQVASELPPEAGSKPAEGADSVSAQPDSDGLRLTFAFAAPTPAALF